MSLSIRPANDDTRLHQMERLQTRLQQGSQRLASGKRIATAADDAAGAAIAQRLAAAIASDEQGARNLEAGLDLLQTADGALQGSVDTLARMRELSVQAGDGALSGADRQTLQQEYDQLAAQLEQTASGANFGGLALLDGSASGAGAIRLDSGGDDPQAVPLPDARAIAASVTGLDVNDAATRDALDAAGRSLSDGRTRLAAFHSAVTRQTERLATTVASAEAARSRIEDVDVAQEVANQTRDRIVLAMQLRGQTVANGATQPRVDRLM